MTYLCASILVEDPADAAASIDECARAGADLVELRVDLLHDDHDSLTPLVHGSPVPVILTVRSVLEGGLFDGSDERYAAIMEGLCLHVRPRYLDIEALRLARSAAVRSALERSLHHPDYFRDSDPRVILSFHDIRGRPADLHRRVAEMAEEPLADILKIVWRARSVRDNLEALELLRLRPKPMIALCMSDEGLPSRVLAAKFDAFLTFVRPDNQAPTGPGQPGIAEMLHRYRVRSITSETGLYGVIGDPVMHSLGPDVHTPLLVDSGIDAVYLPLPVGPGYERFKAMMVSFCADSSLAFRGASVTSPHKEHLLRYAREVNAEIEPLTELIGAANTLRIDDHGRLHVCNTDAPAVAEVVCESLNMDDLEGIRIAVLGAGGFARAAVVALAARGATVVVYNRTFERAEALASALNGVASPDGGRPMRVTAARMEKLCDSCCTVFINATTVGMAGTPNAEDSCIEPEQIQRWDESTLVIESIYRPIETPLVRVARQRGVRVITGEVVFARQAAIQSEAWSGTKPSPRRVAMLVESALARMDAGDAGR